MTGICKVLGGVYLRSFISIGQPFARSRVAIFILGYYCSFHFALRRDVPMSDEEF